MSNGSKLGGAVDGAAHAVSFGECFQRSGHFDTIFKEGMALVERTASYLDGKGRRQARALEGSVSVTYATESMRLTTRLLEIASWLLIRRALRDGEITEAEARRRRAKVRLGAAGRPSHIRNWDELPEELRRLIEASCNLSDRIMQLDRAMTGASPTNAPASAPDNPVASQLAEIESAFGGAAAVSGLNS